MRVSKRQITWQGRRNLSADHERQIVRDAELTVGVQAAAART